METLTKIFLIAVSLTCCLVAALVFHAWHKDMIDLMAFIIAEIILITCLYGTVEVLKEYDE